MNDQDFENFLEHCFEAMEQKQHKLINKFKLGSYERFDLKSEFSEIHFSNGSSVEVIAKVVPIGVFHQPSNVWLWGWANENFPLELREEAKRFLKLHEMTGFAMFAQGKSVIEADMCDEICAMSIEVIGAKGMYGCPFADSNYYFALENVWFVSV